MSKTQTYFLKFIFVYITLFISGNSFEKRSTIDLKTKMRQFICTSILDNNNQISAISLNTCGLPLWIPGQDQTNRFKKIATSLNSRNFEVICLQEVFHPRVRKELVKKLKSNFYCASDYSCNQPILGKLIQKDCYGGLMTWSKYPIIDETFYKYDTKDCSYIEKIGSKGFLFTTILWNNQPINIINTHLYAGTSKKAVKARMKQIIEMEQIINGIASYKLYPTFLFGDLNIKHPHLLNPNDNSNKLNPYKYITGNLGFIDFVSKLDDNSYTINSDLNKYVSVKEEKQKLDYIMVRKPPNYSNPIWLEGQSIEFYGKEALSDHIGWKSTIHIAQSTN